MNFVSPINLRQFELQNPRLQNLPASPSSPLNGQFYLDTSVTPNRMRIWDGTNWWMNATHLNGVDATATPTASKIPIADGSGKLAVGWVSGVLAASNLTNGTTGAGTVVLSTNPVITTPTIADLSNATHTHLNAAGGGTLTAAAISNFDTQVRTNSLSQLASPTSTVNMGNQVLSNLGTPVNSGDATNKGYVDSLANGINVKAPVRVASTANISLNYTATAGTSLRGQITSAPNVVDGVTLVSGNRVLLKDQNTGAQNGIWTVTTAGSGSNGVWDRATDFDTDAEVKAGAFSFVEEGMANADAGFVLTTNNPIVVGGNSGTSLAFAQFSGAGSIAAGNGLTKIGNTLSAVGTAGRISVSGAGIDIDTAYTGQNSITTVGTITSGTWNGTPIGVPNGGTGATTAAGAKTNLGFLTRYTVDVGDGSTTSWVVTHNLNTRDVHVQVRENTGAYEFVGMRVQATTVNTVTLVFGSAPTSGQYRVVVEG